MNKPENLQFTNRWYQQLGFSYQKVVASPLINSRLVAVSKEAAALLDMTTDDIQADEFFGWLSGQLTPKQGHHIAQVYAGHQFGQFVPQLGDGRSIGIGEVKNSAGQHIELQLKGAGPTPYSRMGDGRAVLRSCIREFLASEAMAALDIPTTRALAIVDSDQAVYRETRETGAVMTRMAESHLRFGHFEYFFHHGKKDELNQLADFALACYFPECLQAKTPHLAMLTEITVNTAKLIAKWQAVGFAHGVMNTDNMSVLGLTLDYGPYGFLDDYQPGFICNHSDHHGRYAFNQQPSIGLWNLNALAYTFSTWLSPEQIRQALACYEPVLVEHYNQLMTAKLGLTSWQQEDTELLSRYLGLMTQTQADYTLSFRHLNQVLTTDSDIPEPLHNVFNQSAGVDVQDQLSQWLKTYRKRLNNQALSAQERLTQQNASNPIYILRNYLAQNAIEAAQQGDYQPLNELHQVLAKPFNADDNYQRYGQPAPDWGKHLEISCSS
ncbi:YdiU family protein [Endozoicomonas sp. G2_1]|uniref:protein adenylyltransferase SelO n=1 Tax=Endozoicomonas sp. G2_1 TaxID=2821091 RepID=UPI001ADB8970|nr:YdiU family protein [Endozoicomonas sp. G2_1]